MGAIASLPCLGLGITDAQRKAEGAMCPAWWQAHPPVCGGSWTAEGRCWLCSRLYDTCPWGSGCSRDVASGRKGDAKSRTPGSDCV